MRSTRSVARLVGRRLAPQRPVLARLCASWMGLVLVLAACGAPSATPASADASPTPSPAPTASPASPSPSATSSPTVEPSPAAIGAWAQLVDAPVPDLHDLTAADDGFVGVGLSSDAANPAPAIWRSADGRTWTEEPYVLDTELDPEVVESLSILVSSARGLAAIGSPMFGIAESEDGRAWAYVPLEDGACPVALAARGETVVAVGVVGPCQMGGLGVPGAWSASGGGEWSGAPLDTGGGIFQGVTATAAGFSAWGTVAESPESWICEIGCFVDPSLEAFAGAPWFSADGVNWERVDDPAPFAGATIEGMATAGQITVAVGWVLTQDGAASELVVWRTKDGLSWVRVESDLPFEDIEPGMGIGIGGGGSAGFAVWTQGAPGVTTVVWTSADGISWDAGTELPIGMFHGVSPLGEGLIAYGRIEDADPGIAVPCNKDDVVAGRCPTAATVWLRDSMR
jgi:hypothetical protein